MRKLFGRIDLASLKNRLVNGQDAGDLPDRMERHRKALAELHGGEPQVNTAGKIPEADVVFLDEIFKLQRWGAQLPADRSE